jgi:hypothetical protein
VIFSHLLTPWSRVRGITPLPGLWNGHPIREDFVSDLLTQEAKKGRGLGAGDWGLGDEGLHAADA